MTFYSVRQSGLPPSLPLFGAIKGLPWSRIELVIPQSLSSIRISLTSFPTNSRAANWRRFNPIPGVPTQFFAGSYSIGVRAEPKPMLSRPATINRPGFIVPVPPPVIQLPWNQPPGNSGNVPIPTLVDRYWSLYLWLAEGVAVDVWDNWERWIWVRE